jgi:hypothetical protein
MIDLQPLNGNASPLCHLDVKEYGTSNSTGSDRFRVRHVPRGVGTREALKGEPVEFAQIGIYQIELSFKAIR